MLELKELLVIIGLNIFGVYAFYNILKVVYWFIRDKSSKKEDL